MCGRADVRRLGCNAEFGLYRLEVVALRSVGLGVVALAVVVTSACTSSGSSRPSITSGGAAVPHPGSGLVTKVWPTGTEKVPLRLHVPADWRVTPFAGAPAPTFFPLVYLSRTALPSACPDRPDLSSRHGSTLCFNGNWPVPSDGFIIRWGESENPTAGPFSFAPGHRRMLSGHEARLYEGAATADCLSRRGASEIDATILRSSPGYETFVMYACLGPRAPRTERQAINTMLRTLEIG